MDQNQNNSAPVGTGSIAPVVGGLVIVAILGALVWYVMQGQKAENIPAIPQNAVPGYTVTGNGTMRTATPPQGNSDEIADIQADLDATDLNSLNEVNAL